MSFLEETFGLSGKVVLITGGSRGIGQTAALGFAAAGAEVVLFNRGDAAETVRLITDKGGRAYALTGDVTRESDVDAAIGQIFVTSGRLDVVFNNAGICIHQDTFSASIEDFRRVLDVNLTGEYIVARAAARKMVSRGIRGSIINMASMSGTIVNVPQWQASYNASKAGVMHMTRSLAVEWAPYGIRVNSLSPGYIATPMSVDTPQELKDAWLPLMPFHRMGTPEELIPALLYLASSAAGYTSGSDLIVDGAYTCV